MIILINWNHAFHGNCRLKCHFQQGDIKKYRNLARRCTPLSLEILPYLDDDGEDCWFGTNGMDVALILLCLCSREERDGDLPSPVVLFVTLLERLNHYGRLLWCEFSLGDPVTHDQQLMEWRQYFVLVYLIAFQWYLLLFVLNFSFCFICLERRVDTDVLSQNK